MTGVQTCALPISHGTTWLALDEVSGAAFPNVMRKVIATGEACIDAPEGKICIDPKSQHTSHHMRLIGVNPDHSVRVIKDFGLIKPYWLGEIGCDLTKNDPKTQYSPSNLPKK